jgi:predicted negative regulator of RcsB-dependent stress response
MNAELFSNQGNYDDMQDRSGQTALYLFAILMLMILALVGWLIYQDYAASMQVTANTHAALKHGVSAEDAAFCFSGGGELQLSATNPRNGRCATVATMLSKFFIRIQEPDGNEVTMFCKEKMACIDQVKQYLRNRGYEIR